MSAGGSSTSLNLSSGMVKVRGKRPGIPDPSTPSPGRDKRPPQDSQFMPQKKLRYDKELVFHVLLPNRTSFTFKVDGARIDSLEVLASCVQENAADMMNTETASRKVDWGPQVWLENHTGKKLSTESLLTTMSSAKPLDTIRLIVQDGNPNSSYMDMNLWNVTPKPEMLVHLPQGYTLETALADHVDNALQAVWHNPPKCRRLVSVELTPDKITIFDTGQGMDATTENCIENWGTVGGSMHRIVHQKALGGEPPFLKPYLGKYGAGGIAAAMYLGSCVTVWSKTRQSRLVVNLVLEQNALLAKQEDDPQQRVWKTGGEFRDMTAEEKRMFPHGSFTMVEITKLKAQYCLHNKQQYWKVEDVQQLLKDIYYPYIQNDKKTASSSRTVCEVEFEVNGTELVGVTKCETAISSLHTCHGMPFEIDIHLMTELDGNDGKEGRAARQRTRAVEANARITCLYYPNKKGKESLETVLEELSKLREHSMSFETMHRVTIRWLGRLLPMVKWPRLPFMEVSLKKEQKLGVRRVWAKRVRAFIDTDAGFHPNQSKTHLDAGHAFTVALEQTGKEDFTGTLASGVVLTIKQNGRELSTSQLAEAYLEWLKDMHSNHDEEFTFVDDPIYVFNHPNAMKELGIGRQVILFHKHMKDSQGDWKIDDHSPLHISLPKGTEGLKSDLYATVELFFHDGAEDEHGEVKFLCRALRVHEMDGCKVLRKGENLAFKLNKSQWFRAAVLNNSKRLDVATWKKKVEEVMNKSPGHVEILNEEDSKKLEVSEIFPMDWSKFEAGYTLPKELLVVVRPKKGAGHTWKQGMIVGEPMNIMLTITHCSCLGVCLRRRKAGKVSSAYVNNGHAQLVSTLSAHNFPTNCGVKGVYTFNIGSSEAKRLVMQGTYTFHVASEDAKHKDVEPALASIQIMPSRITSKWTLCNHLEDCTIVQHVDLLPVTIRLNERVQEKLFLQKYDEYDNRQTFERTLDLDVVVVTLQKESLDMQTIASSHSIRGTQGTPRLQIKDLLFRSGRLERLDHTSEALLCVQCPKTVYAEVKCRVLPGPLATIEVTASRPAIEMGSMCFQESLQPGQILKKLTLQGFDACGNKVEKGQKLQVLLEGLEFQDSGQKDREVNEHGYLELGGLIKVTCHYNSAGSLGILSDSGSRFYTIHFKTVTRQLVATKVPRKHYVGRYLEGILLKIVDELGDTDTSIDGYSHSITVDWLKGVTYPFTKGECILPSFQLPATPGYWEGKAYFSANASLSVSLKVELELTTACSLGPARRASTVLTAKCGVPFVFPFSAYDDCQKPGLLTESMKKQLKVIAEARGPMFRPCEVLYKDSILSNLAHSPGYEAHVVLSGPVGAYSITLTDGTSISKGKVQSFCNLQHGKIARLLPILSSGAHLEEFERSISRPLYSLEVTRCTLVAGLTVAVLDSHDNVCSSYEGMRLTMKIPDCPQWRELIADVAHGTGRFESFSFIIPVGTYQVALYLEKLPDDSDFLNEPDSLVAYFSLIVKHGNYPSALKFEMKKDICVLLTEEVIQYLPQMTILVESADGRRLQCRPIIGVKICDANSMLAEPIEYFGTFNETGTGPSGNDLLSKKINPESVTYEFRQVCVPSKAGLYVMEFFIRGSDVPPIFQHLIVKHGPPSRLEIIHRESGKQMESLQINVLDIRGNICEDLSGMEICLELALSKNCTISSSLTPCLVLSKSCSVVKQGRGDFGVFRLSDGVSGIYTLKVFAVEGDRRVDSQSLIPGEVQIFVTRGHISDNIHWQCTQNQALAQDIGKCLKAIQTGEGRINQIRAARMSLKEDIRKLEGELKVLVTCRNEVRAMQEAARDEEILHVEQQLPLRTKQTIFSEIKYLKNKEMSASALALLEAQSGGNYLSPQSSNPAAADILGLVVMLARVENDALNRMLSHFLGLSKLLLIVSRTQDGVHLLEEYDEAGEINMQRGLHGFAQSRGFSIPGGFRALVLSDIRPFWRADGAVIYQHPQKILNIDKPVIVSGQVPSGFLGYAVNLLHLSSEQLQINVVIQKQEVGLRESLFFHLLGFLQVFDTRQHMIAAKENGVRFSGGAFSLDGGEIHRNQCQQLGKRTDKSSVLFATVPLQERMVASLLSPACHAFQRFVEVELIEREMKGKEDILVGMSQRLRQKGDELEHWQKTLGKANTQTEGMMEKSRMIKMQVADLTRAANVIAARNSSLTCEETATGQIRDSDKMQAFLM